MYKLKPLTEEEWELVCQLGHGYCEQLDELDRRCFVMYSHGTIPHAECVGPPHTEAVAKWRYKEVIPNKAVKCKNGDYLIEMVDEIPDPFNQPQWMNGRVQNPDNGNIVGESFYDGLEAAIESF